MAIRIVFLGDLGARFGRDHVLAAADGLTLAEVRRRLMDQVEGCAPYVTRPDIRLMVDQVIVPDEAPVAPGQEVAVLPIYSGG
jgi:molybdopterin converting factor small subunit